VGEVRIVVVVSRRDPVAIAVSDRWGALPATGDHVHGVPLRELGPGVVVVQRQGWHVEDDGLASDLPARLRGSGTTLIFPSIHRSESGLRCFTVHPLGNPGPTAEVGGTPGVLNPSAPRLMADTLRKLHEAGERIGLPATFEATHHGPTLGQPSFFAEIACGEGEVPASDSVAELARVIPGLEEASSDRIALAIGGGHYAPHFTELVLERRWAVGHVLSRHSLERLAPGVERAAWETTPGAEGILPARAADYEGTAWMGIGPRRRDGDAPRR
jgi:D-tyrosyl-tRNA(Tyr) deacylase